VLHDETRYGEGNGHGMEMGQPPLPSPIRREGRQGQRRPLGDGGGKSERHGQAWMGQEFIQGRGRSRGHAGTREERPVCRADVKSCCDGRRRVGGYGRSWQLVPNRESSRLSQSQALTSHVQRRDRRGRREKMPEGFSAYSASSRLRSAWFLPSFGEARRSASGAKAAAFKRAFFHRL